MDFEGILKVVRLSLSSKAVLQRLYAAAVVCLLKTLIFYVDVKKISNLNANVTSSMAP